MTVSTITLNDGHTIPQLGFGVFRVEPSETERIVSEALEIGYRHIDTAAAYGNEIGVGKAIEASGIPREEVFVTTKLFDSDQGTQSAFDAMDLSLEKLGLDYVDLYLIHWPVPSRDLYVESWRALEEIRDKGQSRSIGVSNFMVPHLERLLDETDTVPAIDQIELHPYLQQPEVVEFARKNDTQIESWGPLGQGKYPLLELPEITSAAETHGKTPAQVVIRWHLQEGYILFPKSNSRERMAQNFEVFDFELTADEVAAITALNRNQRFGGDPFEG